MATATVVRCAGTVRVWGTFQKKGLLKKHEQESTSGVEGGSWKAESQTEKTQAGNSKADGTGRGGGRGLGSINSSEGLTFEAGGGNAGFSPTTSGRLLKDSKLRHDRTLPALYICPSWGPLPAR